MIKDKVSFPPTPAAVCVAAAAGTAAPTPLSLCARPSLPPSHPPRPVVRHEPLRSFLATPFVRTRHLGARAGIGHVGIAVGVVAFAKIAKVFLDH